MEKVDIRKRVEELILENILMVDAEDLKKDDVTFDYLAFDFFKKIDLIMAVEKEFGILIYDEEEEKLGFVNDLVELIYRKNNERR
jgi:acyl carrier protein